MTAADVVRYTLIIALGFLAFITFIFAGTIVGLMWLESSRCACYQLPVGLYVLALAGIFFIWSLINTALEFQPLFENWLENQRESVIITLIIILALIIILV